MPKRPKKQNNPKPWVDIRFVINGRRPRNGKKPNKKSNQPNHFKAFVVAALIATFATSAAALVRETASLIAPFIERAIGWHISAQVIPQMDSTVTPVNKLDRLDNKSPSQVVRDGFDAHQPATLRDDAIDESETVPLPRARRPAPQTPMQYFEGPGALSNPPELQKCYMSQYGKYGNVRLPDLINICIGRPLKITPDDWPE